MTRTCNKCGLPKPLTEFHRKRRGVRSTCKTCAKQISSEWVVNNRDQRNASNTNWRKMNRDSTLNVYLKYQYGLSLEEFNELAAEQDGRCKICGEAESLGRLHVDHDHLTAKFRGLLCGPCNRALGLMKDNPDRLRRAAQYLEQPFTRVLVPGKSGNLPQGRQCGTAGNSVNTASMPIART
jgi:hypothetical protein